MRARENQQSELDRFSGFLHLAPLSGFQPPPLSSLQLQSPLRKAHGSKFGLTGDGPALISSVEMAHDGSSEHNLTIHFDSIIEDPWFPHFSPNHNLLFLRIDSCLSSRSLSLPNRFQHFLSGSMISLLLSRSLIWALSVRTGSGLTTCSFLF
jgi:hypothetical protein